MVYNGIGEGSIIERNKQRIRHVKKLSKNIYKIENLIDTIFKDIELDKINKVKENIKILFYENVPNCIIIQMCDIHKKLDYETKHSIKCEIVHRCCTQSKNGFILNMFDTHNFFSSKDMNSF